MLSIVTELFAAIPNKKNEKRNDEITVQYN